MKLYTIKDIQNKADFIQNIASRNMIRRYELKSPISRWAKMLILEMLISGLQEHSETQATYAQFLNVSVSTIKVALKDLMSHNIISLVRKNAGNICVYVINHNVIESLYLQDDIQKRSSRRLKIMSMLNRAFLVEFLSNSAIHLLINMISHDFSAPNYDCRCLETLSKSLFCSKKTITNALCELMEKDLVQFLGYTQNGDPKYDVNLAFVIDFINCAITKQCRSVK